MILIGLGSSLPFCGAEPQEVLRLAIRAIGRFAPVGDISRFYASPAWPDPSDPPFVNAVIAVSTPLSPVALLRALHEVEAAFGRRRDRKNAPRTLDLDLLAFGRLTSRDGKGPDLPHPRLASRDFVLAPLCDIAPDWIYPLNGQSCRQMLAALKEVRATPLSG